MKKKIISIILMLTVTAMVVFSAVGCGGDKLTSDEIKAELLTIAENSLVGGFESASASGNVDMAIDSKYTYNNGDTYNDYFGYIGDYAAKAQVRTNDMRVYWKADAEEYYNKARDHAYDSYLEVYLGGDKMYSRNSPDGRYTFGRSTYFEEATALAKAIVTGDPFSFIEAVYPDFTVTSEALGDNYTLSEMIDVINGTLASFGSPLNINNRIAQEIKAYEVDGGYTLNILEGDYAGKVATYKNDIKTLMNGTLDSAIKTHLGIDIGAQWNSLKATVTKDYLMKDVAELIAGELSSIGLVPDAVYGLVDLLVYDIFGYTINSIDYKDYTLDSFIKEISGGEFDYKYFVGKADSYIGDYINASVSAYIDSLVYTGFAQEMINKMDVFNVSKGELNLTFNFDDNKKLTGISANADIAATYKYRDSDSSGWWRDTDHSITFKSNASASDFGTTTIYFPVVS